MIAQRTMHAAVLHAPGDLRYEVVPAPDVGPGEVLIKVAACGICASDVPRVRTVGAHTMPIIPGHEFAGEVVEKADEAGPEVGELVAVFPLIPCRRCRYCKSGAYEVCDAYDYLGSRSDGAYAELVKAPAWNTIAVPDGVPLDHAALTEPAAVALHAAKRFDIADGDVVAVLGAGPIGLLAAQWARALGAGQVLLVDIDPHALEMAAQLGFEHRIDAGATDPVASVLDATAGVGADLVIEAAGVPQTVTQSVQMARKLGRVVIMGNPSADLRLARDVAHEILRRQLTIKGTWNSTYAPAPPSDWHGALAGMQDGSIRIAPLITHRFALARVHDAFDMLAARREPVGRAVLLPHADPTEEAT
ncbi:MAG: galactitol-1-phosphate 5-dehydrogenase [Armatimonadota bacterium]